MSPADGVASNDFAVVNHTVSPPTGRFAAAPLLDASPILFELIGLPRVGWLLPMYAAQSQYIGFDIESANPIAALKLDRTGLHMTLPAESPWAKSVFTWRDERWADMWKMGNEAQEYEGGAALAVWLKLSTEYKPPRKGRGQRGPGKGAAAKDSFAAHVLVENQRTGAGVLNLAIDRVAMAYPALTRRVWPTHPEEPHAIRKHIQREIRAAKRSP
jgi:hypothetical protein